MRFLNLLILIFFCSFFYAQDTTYLDFTFYETVDTTETAYKKIRFTHPQNKKIDIEEVYYSSGELYSRTWIRKRDNRDNLLYKRVFYKNQQLKEDLKYNIKGLHGNIKTYWPNGQLRRSDTFKNNVFEKGECFDRNGNSIDHVPFRQNAKYPGGAEALNTFILQNLQYPQQAYENYDQGIVKVVFLVDTLGNMKDIKCISSGNQLLDEEALRVVSLMPDWIPAANEGEKLVTRMILPISFRIPYNH